VVRIGWYDVTDLPPTAIMPRYRLPPGRCDLAYFRAKTNIPAGRFYRDVRPDSVLLNRLGHRLIPLGDHNSMHTFDRSLVDAYARELADQARTGATRSVPSTGMGNRFLLYCRNTKCNRRLHHTYRFCPACGKAQLA
jgi:hypothetical protein